MTFIHPWAVAAGAAALAAPIAIHLLTRPRPVRLPLSTLRFVREAVDQKRARYRLRDWIVLILRTLAVAMIAIAFARPMLGSKSIAASATDGKIIRIVILDQSLSMAASVDGVSAFERGRAEASNVLVYQPNLRANVILAAAQARPVFDRLTSNFDALRDELGKARVRTERLNIQSAINTAAEMFEGAGGAADQKLELVVVSDFQRSNWASVDLASLPKQTSIRLESVASKSPASNVGVLRVAAQGRAEQNSNATVQIDVGNYSGAARNVEVELTLGDSKNRVSGTCPPNVVTTLATEVTLPAAGWQIGSARLIGVEDALREDNSRAFVLNVRPPPVYALVTRESSQPRASSSQFLERALVPVVPRDAKLGASVTRIDPAKLDRDSLSAAELVVIDHPGRLNSASANLLAALMRRGKSVLYVAAEPIDASNLKLISDAAGSDLKLPVEFVPPTSGQPRRDLFLIEVNKNEPPFAALGERLNAAIQPLRFGGGLNSRRTTAGLIDDVLASYSDRSAAIVVSACGAGHLAVLNADLNASNLPASPIFVPLLGELVARVLGRDRASDAVACGEPLAIDLPSEAGAAQGLEIVGPNAIAAKDELGTPSDENGFVVWHWPSVGPAGAYQVKRGDKIVYAVATAAPAAESDLQAIDPALLKGRLAGGRAIEFHAIGSEEKKDDIAWAWAVAICAMCMVGEFAALRLFRT